MEGKAVDLPAIAHVWARDRITDLEDRYRLAVGGAEETRGGEGDGLRREIVETSLAHRVLSRFTAFVAVDEREAVTDPSSRRKVVQPVHLPATWSAALMSAPVPMADLAFRAPDGAALAPMAQGGFRGLFRGVLDTHEQLSAPPPSPWADLDRDLLDELARVAEAFAREDVGPDWRSDEGLTRLQALRDRVAALAAEWRATCAAMPAEVEEWLEQAVDALDRLLHLVHEQRRLDSEVRSAAADLGQLASSAPRSGRKSGRRRFWESGV